MKVEKQGKLTIFGDFAAAQQRSADRSQDRAVAVCSKCRERIAKHRLEKKKK